MSLNKQELKAVIIEQLPRLRRFAYSLTGIKEDADDLVQNLVEKLLNKGLPREVKPTPWLLRMCKNLWIDEIRARGVRRKMQGENEGEASVNGEAHMVNLLEKDRVLAAMHQLSDEHRVILGLVAIEELSYAETAEVLELPMGTVMSRIARARKKFAQIIQEGAG